MFTFRRNILPLLLVALHVLALLVSTGHYHAHEHAKLDLSGEVVSTTCHAHGHSHHGGHPQHAGQSEAPAEPRQPEHDHDHCVICQLLAQAAQITLIEVLPQEESAAEFVRPVSSFAAVEPLCTSYHSRAPPVQA